MQIQSLILAGLLAVSNFAAAYSPVPPPQLLARVTQTPGLQVWEKNKPYISDRVFEVYSDGNVHVNVSYTLRDKPFERTEQPFVYSASDIYRFAKSIAQLNKHRKLVETSGEGIPCDGPTALYEVVIDGQETILAHERGCLGSKYRQGRAQLEVDVIKILEDMVQAYHRLQPAN